MNLRDLNREEWAGVPISIRLVGGPADGQLIVWGGLPPVWLVPVEQELNLFDRGVGDAYPVEASARPIEYVRTDHVTDDGEHLYRMGES